MIFVATKKVEQQILFHPSLLLLFLDPRSGMNIPDSQHWGHKYKESKPDAEHRIRKRAVKTDPYACLSQRFKISSLPPANQERIGIKNQDLTV